MEKEIEQLKALIKEGRTLLAGIRRKKRELRPPKSTSQTMASFISARKSVDRETELLMINRLLDRHDLSASERNSLRVRRKSLLTKGA